MWLWRTRHLLAARRAYKSLANRSVVLRNVSLKMTETTVIDRSEWMKGVRDTNLLAVLPHLAPAGSCSHTLLRRFACR